MPQEFQGPVGTTKLSHPQVQAQDTVSSELWALPPSSASFHTCTLSVALLDSSVALNSGLCNCLPAALEMLGSHGFPGAELSLFHSVVCWTLCPHTVLSSTVVTLRLAASVHHC